MTAVMTPSALTEDTLLSDEDHLGLILRVNNLKPIPIEARERYMRKVERREKRLAWVLPVAAFAIFTGLVYLSNHTSSNPMVQFFELAPISIAMLASFFAWLVTMLICLIGEVRWSTRDYADYRPLLGVPLAVERVVDELRRNDPSLRFTVHYTYFDPLLEAHKGEASAFIMAWPHNGRWVNPLVPA